MATTCRSLSVPKGLTTRDPLQQCPPAVTSQIGQGESRKIANNKDILAGPKVIEIEELKSSDRFYLAKLGDKIMTHSTPLTKYLLNFR